MRASRSRRPLPDDALAWVVNTFPEHDIFADTVSTAKAMRLRPYLGTLHTLKTTPAEAEALTGFDARSGADLDRIADWIHAQGVQQLFLTRSADGLFYSTPEERGHVGLEQEGNGVRSTTGAGDAFIAGYIMSLVAQILHVRVHVPFGNSISNPPRSACY